MSARILQINFRFSITPAELMEGFHPLVEPISKVAGLRWKVWSLNEAENEFVASTCLTTRRWPTRSGMKRTWQVSEG